MTKLIFHYKKKRSVGHHLRPRRSRSKFNFRADHIRHTVATVRRRWDSNTRVTVLMNGEERCDLMQAPLMEGFCF